MKSNPFQVKGRIHCGHCMTSILNGETCFLYQNKFTCEECAEKLEIVCECGNYKKDTYQKCYECSQKHKKTRAKEQSQHYA